MDIFFLDLVKAYDTVNHKMLDKLFEYDAHKLISSNMKQKLKNCTWDTIKTGKSSGPLNRYPGNVNDIRLPHNSVLFYADDTAIIAACMRNMKRG